MMKELTDLEEYYDDSLKNKDVVISVFCLTYNHKKYIRKTLDGFAGQRTSVGIEVLIFDDASTDGTSDIVREYAREYPDLFHVFIAKTNTYNHCDRKPAIMDLREKNLRGKYVALCEGDDYWVYRDKLQKQYEIMESMPNVSLCYHNAIRYNEAMCEVVPQTLDMDSGIVEPIEIFRAFHGRPATSSFMFRRELWCNVPKIFMISPVGDEPIRFWCAYNGDIYYIDKVWSVRNFMHSNSWNYTIDRDAKSRWNFYTKYLIFLDEYNKETNDFFKQYVCGVMPSVCKLILECKNADSMSKEEYIEWGNECKKILNSKYDYIFDNAINKLIIGTKGYFDELKSYKTMRIIYGAGDFGKRFNNYLNQIDMKTDLFCQTEVDKSQSEVEGVRVISLEELKKINSPKQIFIAINDVEISGMIHDKLKNVLPSTDDIYEVSDFIEKKKMKKIGK